MSEGASDSRMAQFLYDHPRMMGVLFTLALLTQVGLAAADEAAGGYGGP